MHRFPLVERVSQSVREVLVSAKACVLLLHPQGHCVMLVIDAIHSHRGWVEVLVASLFWKLPWHFMVP